MLANLAAEFLELRFAPQLALCAGAAFLFSLVLGRQVRVAMSRIQRPSAAVRTGMRWCFRGPIPRWVLPWSFLLVGSIATLGSLAAVLWPDEFKTHDSPIMTWICVFIAMSVTFSGLWALPARRNRQD